MRRLSPKALRFAVGAAVLMTLFIPSSTPVKISFVYSNDATDLVGPIVDAFNAEQDEIHVTHREEASGRVKEAIVQGRLHPVIWMPAARTWAALLNADYGSPIAPSDSPTFFWSPEVIGTFVELLDDVRIDGWRDLAELATEGRRFESGPFRLGHTKTTSSTSGLYALLSEFAAVHPAGSPVVDEATIEDVRAIESAVLHYGDIAEEFCPLVGRYGSRYVTAFYMQETTFLQCDPERYRLVEIIPDETYIADYPVITLDAAWVSDAKTRAAEQFVSYLGEHLTREAVLDEKYRYGDPWDEDGTADPAPPDAASGRWKALPVPSPETLVEVQESWPLVRKRADVLIVLERGGQMAVENRVNDAKDLIERFVGDLPPDVHAGLIVFDDEVKALVPIDALSPTYARLLLEQLRGIGPTGGEPALCEALSTAVATADHPQHIDVILVIAEGRNVGSEASCEAPTQRLRALTDRVSPVQVYAISFGGPHGDRLLAEIAEQSLGWCAQWETGQVAAGPCSDLKPGKLIDDLNGIV